MTTDFLVGFGAREGIMYELDAYGIPMPTSTSPYTGTRVKGLNGFNLTQTQVRRIQHFDGDRVSITQIFPSTDVPGGTVTVDGADLALLATLSNVIKTSVSGINMIPILSDQQGEEPSVGMIIMQAAKTDEGADGYHILFINSSQAVPQPGSFGANNYETSLQLSPSSVTHHLWGAAYVAGTDGVESAAADQAFSSKKVRITAWLGDGIEDQFLFDVSLQPPDNTFKLYKSVAGVVTEVTANVTKATTGVTFDAGFEPDEGDIILAIHQVA